MPHEEYVNRPFPSKTRPLIGDMWGDRDIKGRYWTQTEVSSNFAIHLIWALVTVWLMIQSYRTLYSGRKGKPRIREICCLTSLLVGMGFMLLAFILLAVRYELLAENAPVPTSFRLESPFSAFFFHIGTITVLASMLSLLRIQRDVLCAGLNKKPPRVYRWSRFGLIFLLFLYTLMVIAYTGFDIDLAVRAIKRYNVRYNTMGHGWIVSDRDFALTLDSENIYRVRPLIQWWENRLTSFVFTVISWKFYSTAGGGWGDRRSSMVKIQVAMHVLGLAISFLAIPIWSFNLLRAPVDAKRSIRAFYPVLILVLPGLFIHYLYRTVITTHYILWNWSIVRNMYTWWYWIETTQPWINRTTYADPRVFVWSYRFAIKGFSMIDGFMGPLPMLLACQGLLLVAQRLRRRAEVIEAENAREMEVVV